MSKLSSFVVTIQNGKLVFKSKTHENMFRSWLKKWEGPVRIEISKEKSQRTYKQNNALHKFFSLVAQELNNAGYTVQAVLKKSIDIEWDGDKVKKLLWGPIQELLLKIKSTTDLKKTGDIDKVYDTLNRHLGENFFVHIPFPQKEEEKSIDIINYPDQDIDPDQIPF